MGFTRKYWSQRAVKVQLRLVKSLEIASNPSGMSAAASVFLERYDTFSADPELDSMKSMLTNVDLSTSTTRVGSNLKLEVKVDANRTSMRWVRTINGVDYSRLILDFENGAFLDFFDSRSYITIGSSEVSISKEQTIEMALKLADDFSYNYGGKLVENLTIVKDQIRAELKANVRYNPSEYYPCWIIDLPLDAVYPGSIYYIRVKIWADDGQVLSFKEMGYGGPDPGSSTMDIGQTETTPPENENETQAGTNSFTPLTIILITVVLVILLSVFTAVIVIQKRKSK